MLCPCSAKLPSSPEKTSWAGGRQTSPRAILGGAPFGVWFINERGFSGNFKVNLTGQLDRFVANKVKAGLYRNASEVVRAGLRTLQREEQEFQAKLVALRTAIDEGDSSGIARGNVFARVRKSLKLPRGALVVAAFRFSGRARSDLLRIGNFTLRTRGKAQTIRYLTELEDRCQMLADNPASGRSCDYIRPGLRRQEHGSHVVFYRQQRDGILISRILHRVTPLPKTRGVYNPSPDRRGATSVRYVPGLKCQRCVRPYKSACSFKHANWLRSRYQDLGD
jgi:antitoxin ParD1/3/4